MMEISKFNNMLFSERQCGSCPMRGKTFVGADSWNGHAEPVNVLFLGLNPGIEEAKAGLPFVGPSGSFLRKAISLAPQQATWGIANSILCSSANETEIPEPNVCRAYCRKNIARIWQCFLPQVIVPCGNGASSVFEIREGITRAESNWYISRGRTGKACPTIVAPIQHPSALIRSGGQSSSKYSNWQARIDAIFRISRLIEDGSNPENILEENGISWGILFGVKQN